MDSPDESQGLGLIPVAGLLGYGISYSLSPLLHSAADQASGRRCDYQLFDVPPDKLAGFLSRVSQFPELLGFNVTRPHKETLARRLNALHDSAREVNAVNAVALRGEHLIGYNTDRPALASVIRAELKEGELPTEGWTVVLLGGGGGARAVVWAVRDLGLVESLVVSARNDKKLDSFVNDFYVAYSVVGANVGGHPWLDWNSLEVSRPAMLINATPLGNADARGNVPEPSAVPPKDVLKGFDLVIDLVYNPPETGLIQAARESGVQAVGGGGMLVEQAVLSRALWFGEGREHVERAAMVAVYTSWSGKAIRHLLESG